MTNTERRSYATEDNKLGLFVYDLVQTKGKGICIVLDKYSPETETSEPVIYSMSSVTGNHADSTDGMAKVSRYNEKGELDPPARNHSDDYTIVGIKTYCDYNKDILAIKDFINQNTEGFVPVETEIIAEETAIEIPETSEISEEEVSKDFAKVQMELMANMMNMLEKINEKLDRI